MKSGITLLVMIFTLTSFSQTAEYDNSFIRFHLYGKGEPVFVLSGGPGNDCHQEEDVAIKISEKYKAILLEQRGTGLSMPAELNQHTINLDAYIKDILFVMDSLKISKAKFYGHSWGAMYASAFAVKFPEKVSSLVFTAPGYMKLDKTYGDTIFANRMAKLTTEQRRRFDQLDKKDASKMTIAEQNETENLRATFNTYDTTNQDWKFARIKRGTTTRKTNTLMMEDLKRINFDLTQKLKSLEVPITIITCKEDPLAFLTAAYQQYAPRSRIQWLDKCGHFPMYEQPELYYPVLMDALNR
ncbi:MAG: alpha/beta hydrolase [Bacteroidetes bacterium]|nr:alpha/beta hydrolase [Bacteroidota bacterium]